MLSLKIIVQKFGGTSLAMEEQRQCVVHKIVSAKEQGYSVVVVVSAMGRKGDPYATDTLLSLITQNDGKIQAREQDLLLSCGEIISAVILVSLLNKIGIEAIALSGPQAGIVTTDKYGDSRIISVNPDKIKQALNSNKVVVVAGFQGQSEEGEITTLGRGGSDTTAAALGVALEAEAVEIYTDVDGIKTADPKIVEDAKTLAVLTYNEICHLAKEGAKVIHPRAVEIAMQYNLPLKIKSTFSHELGTVICRKNSITELNNYGLITGIAQISNITQFKISTDKLSDNIKEIQVEIFKALALANISIDFININPAEIIFTVKDEDTAGTIEIIEEMGINFQIKRGCAKISAVGAGMTGVPGVMAQIVESLSREGIEILQSADSHTTIWCLVKNEDMKAAVRALHKKFIQDNNC